MPKGVKGFQKGHVPSEETKRKIGLSNKGVWIEFQCDFCKKENTQKQSAFNKQKRHFCDRKCYALFRKLLLSMEEQHAYKGIRKPGDDKQIYHKRYKNGHKERIAHLKARHYARKKNAEGFHTLEEWNILKEKSNNLCTFCKQQNPLTKDHIIPLSEGGTDYISNIQPLCRNCNSKKWKSINFIYEHPNLLNNESNT